MTFHLNANGRSIIQSLAGRLTAAFFVAGPLTLSICVGGMMLITSTPLSIETPSRGSEHPSDPVYMAVRAAKPDQPDIQALRVVYVPRWGLDDMDMASQIEIETGDLEPDLSMLPLSALLKTGRHHEFGMSQSHDLPI